MTVSPVPTAQVAVAVIGRDKFSHGPWSLESLCREASDDTSVVVYDSGYPEPVATQMREVQGRYPAARVRWRGTGRFANTNQVWNQFTREHPETPLLMCLENDVAVEGDAVAVLADAVRSGFCDVAVPRVHEGVLGTLHFDPVESRLDRFRDGSVESVLIRRPKYGLLPPPRRREVAHLERHAFLMSQDAAQRLGQLDEQMYCRTDMDISLACRAAGLRVGLVAEADVIFRRPPTLAVDRDFYEYRWNLEKVAFANARLIDKWNLIGYKTTISHAHRIRRFLEESQPSAVEGAR